MATPLADLIATYEANADYAEVGKAAKAKAFVTVCRKLLIRLPMRSSQGWQGSGAEAEYAVQLIRDELLQAQRWLNARDTEGAPSVVYPDFADYRE